MAETDYLCFTALEAGSTVSYVITVYYYYWRYYTGWTGYYSFDGETWKSYTVSLNDNNGAHSGTTIKLTNVGDKVYFKGRYDNPNDSSAKGSVNNKYSYNTNNYFKMTGKLSVSGDITTYATNYASCASDAFKYLFSNCTSLIDASGLILPSTAPNSCYYYMFNGCTSLVTPPELPATTLASYCYRNMFYGCTSLTQAPELPATTLASQCYYYMFYGCTSLKSLPELPATTLASGCYSNMFYGCTSLTQAPKLPATTLATYCYRNMFYGCTSLVTPPELPATTLATYCYDSMFYGCTSLVTPPELPATTLATYCYDSMFYGCTSLKSLPELPATTLASSCYSNMFYGCTGLENPKLPDLKATTLPIYCYSSMFEGCTGIKLSTTQTEEYNTPFRVPTTGTGSGDSTKIYYNDEMYGQRYVTCYTSNVFDMFKNTGGTFTGTNTYICKNNYKYLISLNTTYYYPYKKDPVPNKVTYGETVLIDLTGDTVKPAYVRSGVTFHTADGQSATGTASTGASSALSGTPGINKVIYNGKTLIDLTADTITPGDVISGYTFHACDGNQYTGIA